MQALVGLFNRIDVASFLPDLHDLRRGLQSHAKTDADTEQSHVVQAASLLVEASQILFSNDGTVLSNR